MPDSTRSIGRRRLLSSLGVLGTASAASGLGTWALLSDTDRTPGSVTAGTLNLRVGDGGAATLAVDDVQPGDSSVATIPVSNHGTVADTLGLTVLNARPAGNDEGMSGSNGGSDSGRDESGGPVSSVEFDGCGGARIVFAPDAATSLTVRVTAVRGRTTAVETRTVERSDTTAGTNGGRVYQVGSVKGKLTAVGVGDRTWQNPNACAKTDNEDSGGKSQRGAAGPSVSLFSALTLAIGYEDAEPIATDDPLVGPARATGVETLGTVRSDRTLAPTGDESDEGFGAGDDTAVLYVTWSVDSDPAEPLADGTVEIELQPEIHR